MVTVDQNITIAPTSIERDQPAFIFGPNYELHRYDNAEEKAKTFAGTFSGPVTRVGSEDKATYFKYPNVIYEDAVDTRYTKLTGDNVVVELASLTDAALPEKNMPAAMRAENGGYTKLLFEGKSYVDRDVDGKKVERNDLPRNLVAGDVLLISYKEDGSDKTLSVRTNVVDVKYSSSAWELDSDSSSEGAAGTLITIDDAIPENVDPSTSVKVKLVGILQGVEFTSKNLKKGSGYQWEQGEYTDDGETFKGVKVDSEIFALVDGFDINKDNEPDYCKVLFADMFITYRELRTDYSDTFHSVTGASEVAIQLGKVDPDNPLAMGVYMAALNSATDDGDEAPPVYFMSVPSDDKAGYEAVLNRATLTDRAYVFAPTTRDDAVLELVRNHVLEMSTKTVKMWRIAVASAEIPDTVTRLSRLSNNGDDFFAIPVADALGHYNSFRVVMSESDTQGNASANLKSNVVEGDTVRIFFVGKKDNWGEQKYADFIVDKVSNNYTVSVKLKEGLKTLPLDGYGFTAASGGGYNPEKIEIYHTYTPAESADEIAKVSKEMASRRMVNVFPSIFGNDGVIMTGEFAACAVAGLISATEPQQPITNVTVRGIDDIPLVYQTYNNEQLDTIAAGGTFIIAQDLPGDLVYVRHQITTAYPDGNLNTAELSITKNVDSISYAFAQVFRPYYGKYNITPELVAILENLAKQLISQFGGSTSIYGPQLITDETEIKYIRQNELMKDHVDVAIKLGVPYPCNNIDIVLTV
jgi:hypothetical protein